MAKNSTRIVCYDDHRGFAEEIKKRFTDPERYQVLSFQTREEVVKFFGTEREHKFCKIAILGLHESAEQYSMIDHVITEIKKTDDRTGIILLGPPDKMEEIKKILKINIDAYIPKNANMVLRVHNAVKKLISEHNIEVFRKRRNSSFYALISFLLLSVILIILSYFRLPQFF